MTKEHLESKIADCLHQIKRIQEKGNLDMVDILEIYDLEEDRIAFQKRIDKMYPDKIKVTS